MHQNNAERYHFIKRLVESQTRQNPDASGEVEQLCAGWNMESIKTGACIPPVLLHSLAELIQLSPSAAKWLQQVWASGGPYADKKLPLARSWAYIDHTTRRTESPLTTGRAILEDVNRRAEFRSMCLSATSKLQLLVGHLQLNDITILHLFIFSAAQRPAAKLDSLLSAVIKSGDSVDQWSQLTVPKTAAGATLKSQLTVGSVSRTPLTMAVEQSQGYLAMQLVSWGASVGVPLYGPPPPAMPFTSPLHAATSLPSAQLPFDDLPREDVLQFMEDSASSFHLLTLDSNGKLYTELLQECKEVCTLAGNGAC